VKQVAVLVLGFAVLIAAGCESEQKLSAADWGQKSQLRQEEGDLKAQLEKLQATNERLQEQIKVLSKLPPDSSLDELYGLKKLVIARRTGLYDKDKDGKKEKLIVYLRPVDGEGDAIKAAGEVRVELWDLNQEPQEALLAKWHVKPAELQKLWVSGALTHYYRLSFDIAEQIKKELTVRLHFTDYLTGKVLTAQTVVKP